MLIYLLPSTFSSVCSSREGYNNYCIEFLVGGVYFVSFLFALSLLFTIILASMPYMVVHLHYLLVMEVLWDS